MTSGLGHARTVFLAVNSAFVMAVGMMPFFALGVLAPYLVEDLDLTTPAVGALPTSLFLVAAAGSSWAGRAVDAHGPRLGMAALFGCASASWTVIAVAQDVWVLVLGIALGGGALSFAIPSVTRLLVGALAGRRLGVVFGLAHSGTQLGAVAVGLLLPTLADWLGWRMGLHLVTALPLGGLALAYAMGRGPSVHADQVASRQASPRRPGEKSRLQGLAVFAFLANGTASAGVLYLPTYGHEALGLTVRAAGMLTAVIGASSAVAKVAWGVLTSKLTPAGALGGLLAVSSLGVVMLGLAPLSTVALLLLGTAVFGASMTTWTVPTTRFAADISGPWRSGGAAGAVMFAGYAGGAVGPLLYGAAVSLGGYAWGWTSLLLLIVVATGPVRRLRLTRTDATDDG